MQYDLLIDLKNKQLIDADSDATIGGITVRPDEEALALNFVAGGPADYENILREFPSLMDVTFSDTKIKHDIQHHIVTTGQPVHARMRRLSPEKLKTAKKEFQTMLDLGIIRPSSSN